MKRLYSSGMIIMLCCTTLAAQTQAPHTLWFHTLDADKGLTQSYNWYVCHDSEGFVWISSLSGLSRFDGQQVRLYSAVQGDSTSLDGENIYSEFFEDKRQDIWFSTPGAVHCYLRQEDRFRHFDLLDDKGSVIDGEYRVHFLEKDSFLWVGTGKAVYRFDIHHSKKPAQLVTETTQFKCRMDTSADGSVRRLFAFGMSEGLEIHEIRSGARSGPVRHLFAGDFIREVIPENRERIWVATGKTGLAVYDPDFTEVLQKWPDFAGNPVAPVLWGKRYILLVVRGKGIFVIDREQGGVQQVDCRFIDGNENAIASFKNAYLDRYDNLWISDESRGVHYANLNKTRFRSIPKHPGATNNNYAYWSLAEDSRGHIWAGVSPGGIFHLDPQGKLLHRYTHRAGDPHSLPSDWVRNLLLDADNTLWAATSGGLARFDPQRRRFQIIPTVRGKTDGQYVYLHRHKASGKLLAVSENEGIFEVKNTPAGPQLVNIWPASYGSGQTLFEDRSGRLYAVYNSSSIRVFAVEQDRLVPLDSIPAGGLVNGFYEDDCDDALYFATSFGLVKANRQQPGNALFSYTETNGLPGKLIGAMAAGADRKLWLGTGHGLAVFQGDSIRAFSLADGAQSTEFHITAAMKRANGDLWFGGTEGITIVPGGNDARPSGPAPRVLLTGIRINDAAPDSLRCRQTGATSIPRLREIVLPYHENTISLEFVAIEYSDPSANRLWYRLEGRDDHWVAVDKGAAGFARYAKLPHGKYRFLVMAASSNGVTGEPKEVLQITVEPPWYLTWWAKLLATLSILGILYAFYRYRIDRLEMLRKEAEFKQKEAEYRQREAENRQQMAETETAILRLQMNPHFIFNSMNSINAFMLKHDIDTASDYLGRFADLMRAILNLAAKPSIPVSDEIELLEKYLRTEAMRFEKSFSYTFDVDPDIDPDDTVVPTMILQPFVENAIWHGLLNKNGAGHIRIGFKNRDGQLVCSVEDDGIGREAARRIKNGASVHGSKALAITRRRLELLQAETGADAGYQIEDLYHADGQAAGTRIEVHLPML
jgi:ligand-binding sensor domain-containing protein/two-component sensor histidine kinase